MRRTDPSLRPSLPSALNSLLPPLLCPVCGQLLVHPVVLPCSHSACDYCLLSHLSLKAEQCPVCDAPVDEEDLQEGRYAVHVEALDRLAAEVAAQALDERGQKARRRRERMDGAEMKRARTRWKRRAAVQKRRERKEAERAEIEEEMRLFKRRMRPQAQAARDSEDDGGDECASKGGSEGDGGGDAESDEEADDVDFVPDSEVESDDSVGAVKQSSRRTNGKAAHRRRPSSSDGEDEGGDDDSDGEDDGGSSDSDSGQGSSGEDGIGSSEEDSDPTLDRSLIIPSPRRARPQRTSYTAALVKRDGRKRGGGSPPLLCKFCSHALQAGELGVCIQHGASDVQWSHVPCLAHSITGRAVPLSKLQGLRALSAEERETVRLCWDREDDVDLSAHREDRGDDEDSD